MKICTTCKELKPLDGFYNSKVYSEGKSYRCKNCDATARRAYHDKHYHKIRDKQRDSLRKWKYSLTKEQFDALFKTQNGCCAICGIVLSDEFGKHHVHNKLVIDHNHTTGKVRGLLCTMCNKGIGLLKDDITILENALRYLNAEIH